MTGKRATADQLRAKITDALIRDVGVSERMAQPFVDSIMACFAGEQPYFPAHQRHYPVLQIRAALEGGESVKRVMHAFDVSRTTLHKLFPGGLPKPVNGRDSAGSLKMRTK